MIPAHNRPDFLEKTINAILEQSVEEFELLVVGFKGNGTIERVKPLFSDKRIRFFKIASSFPDKKRNFGIKKAGAEIVAFTDDDCIPDKNWLDELLKEFKDKKLAGVEGLTYNDNKRLFFHATENLEGGKFPACNYAFRKKWLEKVKGFDEEYNFFREDTDLAFKVLNAGGKVKFSDKARVFHPPRKLPLHFPLKELKMVKGDVRLFKKFPSLYKMHFGFVCRGSFKQALVSWFLALVALFSALFMRFEGILAAAVLMILFKYLAEISGKKANPIQILFFSLFSFLRDLLFPFYFVGYFLKSA